MRRRRDGRRDGDRAARLIRGGPIELEDVACNLCGERQARVLYERPYPSDPLAGERDWAATTDVFGGYGRVVHCPRCGLVYADPRPTRRSLLAGYGSCVDASYLAESSSRSINAHFSLNTIKRFASAGRMLEIGASVGYFLNAARADFEVVGLEPSRWACAIAREKFKLPMHEGPAQDAERFEAESFDVVAMIDVIEHLDDPMGVLTLAARALKPGGLLYLVTPDISSLSARLLGPNWWGLRPAHLYYFSGETLGLALTKAGLQTVFQESFGRIFSWGYWASRLRHYPRPLTSILSSLIRTLDIERKMLYLNTRDSVEVCARKGPVSPAGGICGGPP